MGVSEGHAKLALQQTYGVQSQGARSCRCIPFPANQCNVPAADRIAVPLPVHTATFDLAEWVEDVYRSQVLEQAFAQQVFQLETRAAAIMLP